MSTRFPIFGTLDLHNPIYRVCHTVITADMAAEPTVAAATKKSEELLVIRDAEAVKGVRLEAALVAIHANREAKRKAIMMEWEAEDAYDCKAIDLQWSIYHESQQALYDSWESRRSVLKCIR